MEYLVEIWSKIKKSSTQQVMSITSVGMVLSLLRDILIAARFGTSEIADALIIALTLPLFFDTVARESTKYSLVPIFIKYKENYSENSYYSFISGMINLSLLISCTISVVIFIGAPVFIHTIGPGLSNQASQAATEVLQLCIPIIAVFPIISILSVALNSTKKFNIVALRNTIIPLCVILGLGISWSSKDTDHYVAIGYSIGYIIYPIFLWVTFNKHSYNHSWFKLPTRQDLDKITSAISWPTIGFLIRQLSRILERTLTSLIGVGGVSSYYFSFRIYSGLQSLVGTSIATTSLPSLSEQKEYREKMNRIFNKNLLVIFMLCIPITLIVILFSEEIVRIIFSRGNFDQGSVNLTSKLLSYFIVGVVFAASVPLLNSTLYVFEKYYLSFKNMVAFAIINILLMVLLSNILGIVGIALSVACTAIIGFGVILYELSYHGIYFNPNQLINKWIKR